MAPDTTVWQPAILTKPERNMTISRLWVNYQCPGLYPGLRTSLQCNVPWQSSRPASFSPAVLTLWPNRLERWLVTLSVSCSLLLGTTMETWQMCLGELYVYSPTLFKATGIMLTSGKAFAASPLNSMENWIDICVIIWKVYGYVKKEQ